MPDACRLYLISPRLDAATGFAPELDVALAAGDVACVLLRLAPGQEGTAKAILKPLVAAIRARDAAALLEDDTRLVGHLDADGVHLSGLGDGLEPAIRSMKPARIVGCGGLATRDDAMQAGESGADYVMFGDAAEGLPFAARRDRVAWWAEIFEVPGVACATALDEVRALAGTGVEFVALGEAVWNDPRGTAAAMADAVTFLRHGIADHAARLAETA